MQRCIDNDTFSNLLGNKVICQKVNRAISDAPIMFKDTVFLDFLGLPKKYNESKLKNGLIEHMKQFILELGKDFIFMDQEYPLTVGASTYKARLAVFSSRSPGTCCGGIEENQIPSSRSWSIRVLP